MAERQIYEMSGSNGQVYEIEAENEAQAQRLADFIEERIAAGDPELRGAKLPDRGIVQYDQEPEAIDVSATGSFARGAVEGGTLNWGDELSAFGNAAIPGLAQLDNLSGVSGEQETALLSDKGFWDTFKHNLEEIRALQAADEAQHPSARTAGNVVGAVGTGLAAGPRAARIVGNLTVRAAPKAAIPIAARASAARIGSPVSTAVAEGAALGTGAGGVAGAGAGTDEESRIKSAKIGAGAGAVLGTGASAVLAGLGPAIRRYWNVLRGKNTEEEAVRQIITALERDGYDVSSLEGIQAIRDEINQFATRPVSLGDIGYATRARTGVGLRAPSKAQTQAEDTIRARQAGQGERLRSDILSTVAPRADVHALDEKLVAQRAEAAEDLRRKALFEDQPLPVAPPQFRIEEIDELDTGLMRTLGLDTPEKFARVPQIADDALPAVAPKSRIVEDPVLQQLARLPDAQRALQAALARAESERGLRATLGESIDDIPDLSRGSDLDVRTFDYLKRFLDDEVNALYRGADTSTFKAAQAGQVKALRDAIRNRLKTVVPEYGEYLDTYKGSSDLLDALRSGRDYRKLDPEMITTEQAARTTGEQELYRVGVARDLIDQINDTRYGANAATRIMASPEADAQLAATGVPSEMLEKLRTGVSQERQLNLLPAELAGSQTQQRVAAAADADAGIHAALPFNPGSPYGWLGAGVRGILNHARVTRNAAVNEALLPRMLETDRGVMEEILSEIQTIDEKQLVDEIRRRTAARRAAGALGATIGAPVALPAD